MQTLEQTDTSKDMKVVADAMTRLLLGNKKTALFQLNHFIDELPKIEPLSNEDYNSLYYDTYKKMIIAVKSIYL